MVLEPAVPVVKRIKPHRLKHEFAAAWRTELKRPDGVTFVRTAAPNNSFLVTALPRVIGPTAFIAIGLWQQTHRPEGDGPAAAIVWAGFMVYFAAIVAIQVRTLVRRRRAEAEGRWPYGLTTWPDRLISFVSESEAIVAPRAALDGFTVEDDGTIGVQSTDAYGTTTTTKLGVFSGEPDALRRLLDDWFVSSAVAA